MTNTPHSNETEAESDIEQSLDDSASDAWGQSEGQTDPDRFGSDSGSSSGTTGSGSGPQLESTTIRRYLVWGALGGCAVLALVATVQFYWSVGAVIDLWVDQRYQPVMRAAFNLVVLLGSLVGISLLVRELS